MKAVTILGSTGSIGVQSLDVIDKRGYEVCALAAGTNVSLMEQQIRKYKPSYAAMFDESAAAQLKLAVGDLPVKILSGAKGVCECAQMKSDIVINAIVGMAGLEPTLCAVESGKAVALANKETMVAGGKLVTSLARRMNCPILPVDSEHSAIFQCLRGMNDKNELKRVILTASGGPFWGKSREQLRDVTLEQALKHPNWSMGEKITVDSATMMNKGLELIEAVWLFDVEPSMVDIVVHRESVVHSMIEYADNSVIAQLGIPDMRIPIQYALTFPRRFVSPVGQLNLCDYGTLSFSKPDYDTFGCINICKRAIEQGGLYPAAVNSANEAANLLFRQGDIRFLEIEELVGRALEQAPKKDSYTFNDVIETDRLMRRFVLDAAGV